MVIYAYIDETGDRGLAGTKGSSPIFGMAAVLVSEKSAPKLRAAVTDLRATFSVPHTKVMSWKEHVKSHARRQYAAKTLAAVPDVWVSYVYCQKDQVSGAYTQNRELFYNYVAFKLYKNILWAARNWQGTAGVHTRYGHVRGHDHTGTKQYLEFQASMDPKVPHRLERGLQWVSADKYLESQAADLYGGFLRAAVWPAEFDLVEPQYLKTVWPQVRKGYDECAIPLGFMSMPDNGIARKLDWNDCVCKYCNAVRAP
ncbi:DUF3800 domain-containing protein [Cryobacterium sp. BB307]|uniref:DUF3800 domain-containing protein n=1 Tax=Cryobacterium sp. BB307 TaxID=2716317 RepID=UPI001445F099